MVLPNFFKSVRKQGNTFRLFGKKHKNIAVWMDPQKTAFCLLYAISPFSYHRSSVAQIEPLCQPPEHNRKVLTQPHKESCLSRCRAECEGNPKISRTLKSSGYSLESTVLLLSQNIARSRTGKNSAKPSGDPVPGKKGQRPGFPLYRCPFSVSYSPCCCWRKAFSISPIIRSRRGVFRYRADSSSSQGSSPNIRSTYRCSAASSKGSPLHSSPVLRSIETFVPL